MKKNFESLKSLYSFSKPLFFLEILKDLEFIKDNKLLKALLHIELGDIQHYDMENFKLVLTSSNKDLKLFMVSFINLKASYQACFEDFQIIKVHQFEKTLAYL